MLCRYSKHLINHINEQRVDMPNIINRAIFIILVLCMINCSSPIKNINHVSLSYKQNFSIDSVETKPILLNPINMTANDSLLIVYNFKTDTLFRVFDINKNFKYKGWFGLRGKGPKEFLSVSSSGLRFHNELFQVSDLRKIELLRLPPGEIKNNFSIEESYMIPGILLALNKVIIIDDLICGVNRRNISPKSIDFFNKNTNKVGSFVEYPNLQVEVPDNMRRVVFDNLIDVRPDGKTFAVIYHFFPLLRICDKNGNVVTETYIDGLPEQIKFRALGKKETNLLNGIGYYSDIKTTQRYIYALFEPQQGEKRNERIYDLVPIGEKEVHIFDWTGNGIGRIKLAKGAMSFTPSNDDKSLYISNDRFTNKLYVYKFKSYQKD